MSESPRLLFVNDEPQAFHDAWYGFDTLRRLGLELYLAAPVVLEGLEDVFPPERFIRTDPFDPTRLCQDVTVYCAARDVQLDGVGTVIEELVPAVADLAAALGLPGLDPGAARRTSVNKLLMRDVTRRAGIRTPRYRVVPALDRASLTAAVEAVGVPCVVKPLSGFLSFGVRKIEDPGEIDTVIADVTSTWSEDKAPGMHGAGGAWLVEEYASGTMLSADGIVQDGRIHLIEPLNEFLMGPEPHFLEIGARTPARIGAAEAEACRALAHDLVRALGLDRCAFHAELRLTPDGPVLIEIAGREPGVVPLYAAAYGIDFAAAQVDLWLDRPVDLAPKHELAAVGRAIFPERAGTVTAFDGAEEVGAMPDVWAFIPMTAAGARAVTYPDAPQALVYYGVVGEDDAAADAADERVRRGLRIEIGEGE